MKISIISSLKKIPVLFNQFPEINGIGFQFRQSNGIEFQFREVDGIEINSVNCVFNHFRFASINFDATMRGSFRTYLRYATKGNFTKKLSEN